MKRTGIVLATGLGVLATIYLTLAIGLHSVLAAIVSLGWTGFALICFLAVAQFGLLSAAWLVLIPACSRKMWPTFLWGGPCATRQEIYCH